MKVAHIGDCHLGMGYQGPTPEARFDDIVRVMDWCADRIIEESCDLVLLAGDFFKDARVYIDRASIEIKAAAAWLRKITAASIPVVVISGTPYHDAIAAYELLREMNIPLVYIYTQRQPFSIMNAGIACLPGMNRSGLVAQDEYRNLSTSEIHQVMTDKITDTCQEMLKELREDDPSRPAILLGHLSYDLADKGFEDVLMQHEPVLTPDAIQGYDLVCLGHIHRPQQAGNVFYCGSPDRLTFNDEEITPGFWVHEMVGKTIASRFIGTPARPFFTLDWNEDDIRAFLNNETPWNNLWEVKNTIVRVRYTCSEATAKQLDKRALERRLYEEGAFHVSEISGTMTETVRDQDDQVTAEMDPVQALRKWCEQPEIGIPEEEATSLVEMTKSLLEGVSI